MSKEERKEAKEAKRAKKARSLEQEEAEGPASLSNFARIFTYGTRVDNVLIAICVVGAIGAGIAMPLMFLILGRIVGDLASYFTPFSKVTKDQFMAGINKNTLIMLNLAIARLILAYISLVSIRISGVRISARLRLAYIKALFKQSVTTIDELSPGAVASRLTNNSNLIESGITQQFFLATQAIAFTIGLFVVAFVKNWLLTLVALIAIPIVLIAYAVAVPFLNKFHYQAEAERDKASALSFEIFQSIRIVQAFGAQQRLAAQHDKILDRARLVDRKQAPVLGAMFAPMFLAIYGIFALTFWFGVRQFSQGKLHNISTIIVVLFSVLWAVMSVYHLYNPIIHITRAASASAKIFAVIDAEIPDETKLIRYGIDIKNEDIIFNDVSFAYPTRKNITILNNLSLRFQSGKTTAIVGPSGSGKSTLVGLIEKWYQPLPASSRNTSHDDSGIIEKDFAITTKEVMNPGIFIGDVNINDIESKWWRTNIGLVQQEPALFNDTIFSNVANGLSGTLQEHAPESKIFELVQTACREALAEEFILRLPEGYQTKVGEGGMKLSGGQRQRIAIARAIIKNPSILILDEATSAIDVRTERLVQRALDRVSKNRTTITIAHRLSTIKKADRIIVLRDGQVMEAGIHNDLVRRQGGFYRSLVKAQEVDVGEEHDDNQDPDAISTLQPVPDVVVQAEHGGIGSENTVDQDDPKIPPGGFLSRFFMLLGEQKPNWFKFFLMFAAAALGSATYPIQAWLFAKVIDVFTKPGPNMIPKGNFLALMFVVQAFAVGTAFLLLGWIAAIIGADVTTHYRQEYLENIMKRKIAYFDSDKNSPGTLVGKLSTDSTGLRQLIAGEMALQLVAVFGIIGSVTIAFVYGWKLSLVGIATIMPLSMVAGFYRVHLERSFERMNAEVFAETAQFGAEAIALFRTCVSNVMEDKIIVRFDKLLAAHLRKAVKKARFSTIVFAFSESAEMFCQPLFFWYGGKLLADRGYDLIAFFVIYMAIVQSSASLGMWFSFAPNIAEATAATGRVMSVRESPEDKKKLPTISNGTGPASIEFRNIHFTYGERSTPVLQGVSLKIQPGQFVAFVGASGSGKSTMISLLEKFYTPTNGEIYFDGIDINSIDSASYRQKLSLVAQESTLYEGSIRENISLSVPESEATDYAIHEACKAAQIHNFIISLPDGYNTFIGSKGVALSGGQRQRIALARALLRSPQVLLLDEATSNLDSESEKQVQRAIEGAARGRTIIAVAHRLSTIRNADVIFVLGSGRVLEYGDHSTLLSRRGMYFQMCQAQAMDR